MVTAINIPLEEFRTSDSVAAVSGTVYTIKIRYPLEN
jgi:hypothetical protein